MVYHGHVKNGVVVLDGELTMPEGTEVRIEPVEPQQQKTLYERLKNVVGIAKDLPTDFAAQHDHYIHGTPKK